MTSEEPLPGPETMCCEINSAESSVSKPAAIQLANHLATVKRAIAASRVNEMNPSTDLMGLTFGSLKLAETSQSTDKSDGPDTCTMDDCPLKGMVHNKGLFLYDGTPILSVQFHHDFGYSNPPPWLWMAYVRYTQYLERCGMDSLDRAIFGTDPYDDLRPNDEDVVKGFLRYHAVTLEERGERLMEVQLRGDLLNKGEPLVAGLDALRL
ncbi:MAG: hypothetical protein Q9169_000798 [Polycauliona sp. 2 TL-2023]